MESIWSKLMVELKSIAAYDSNFTKKHETDENKGNGGADFREFMNGEIRKPDTTVHFHEGEKENIKSNKSNSMMSDLELVTYDYFGKISKMELFTGINVNALI